LKKLDISGNYIESLENLPPALERLEIAYNSLLSYTSPLTRKIISPKEINKSGWRTIREEQRFISALVALQRRFKAWYRRFAEVTLRCQENPGKPSAVDSSGNNLFT
jgi:Leucine-rich repeat (LRR) protein